MVYCYYEIGRMIVEDEQQGKHRAGYGKQVLQGLSAKLVTHFGKGFSVDNLENMRRFYLVFSQTSLSDIAKSETMSRQLTNEQTKSETMSRNSDSVQIAVLPKLTLSWSLYIQLLRVDDPQARHFYEIEAFKEHYQMALVSSDGVPPSVG